MQRILSIVLLTCAGAAASGCSKSPAGPSDSNPSNVVQGRAVNAVDGSVQGGVAVHVAGRPVVNVDGEGNFDVEVHRAGTFDATFRGGSIVERQTTLINPSSGRTRVSLIPSSFDLAAFDEMFRTANGRLQRWTSRPSLVIVASVMQYHGGGTNEYEATAEQMTDDEVNQLTSHLTEGLSLLTGGSFTSFQSVDVERPAAGARVTVSRNRRIVVGRYRGIVSMVNTIGYGQWTELSNGTVVGGEMYLDRDFDRDDTRRRLLRIHELGHALGYLHVESRRSIMNPSIGPEPTEFDRHAATIAFQRMPGNRSPDIDPSPGASMFVVASGGGQRQPPVYCK